MAHKSASLPALVGMQTEADQVGDMGEHHINRQVTRAKEKLSLHMMKLDNILEQTSGGRPNAMGLSGMSAMGFTQSTPGSSTSSWRHRRDGEESEGLTTSSMRRHHVSAQATELDNYRAAEHMTRNKEEMNLGVPTLRQVCKVDDLVPMKQMTMSQLAALPFNSRSRSEQKPKRDPNAGPLRHGRSYRPSKR